MKNAVITLLLHFLSRSTILKESDFSVISGCDDDVLDFSIAVTLVIALIRRQFDGVDGQKLRARTRVVERAE